MSEIKDPQCVLMPFGKYQDEMLGDMPKSYLEWAVDELDLNPWLKDAMERTLRMM